MDSAAKRRQELLNQTRKMYSDKYKLPAVHPRYGSFGMEKSEINRSTGNTVMSFFKFRIIIALTLFVLYAGVEYADINVGKYSYQDVVEVISQNIDIQEVWNSW